MTKNGYTVVYFKRRYIIETEHFSNQIKKLLKKNKLVSKDYDDFLKFLEEYPCMGEVITGTNGVRKIRIKTINTGKKGECRILYYYIELREKIYLLWIYAKSQQTDIDQEEKKALKALVNNLKKESYHEQIVLSFKKIT